MGESTRRLGKICIKKSLGKIAVKSKVPASIKKTSSNLKSLDSIIRSPLFSCSLRFGIFSFVLYEDHFSDMVEDKVLLH